MTMSEKGLTTMKRTVRLILLAAALVSVLLTPLCWTVAAQDDKRTTFPIKELTDALRATGEHEIFLNLIATAGQGFPLGFRSDSTSIGEGSRTGMYTILAPTNAAFAKLPAGVVETLKKDSARLRAFLLAHIVAGKLTIADLLVPVKTDPTKTLLETTNLAGDKMSFLCNAHPGEHHPRVNGVARIGKGDIQFSAGVIHDIDTVLIQP